MRKIHGKINGYTGQSLWDVTHTVEASDNHEGTLYKILVPKAKGV